MKNFFNKILLVALVAVLGGALSGCNPEQEIKPFSLTFKGFGPGYVSCYVTLPHPVTASYVVDDIPREDIEEDPYMLLLEGNGTKTTFYTEGVQQLLDFPVEENKKYYVYLVGLLENGPSKLYKYEFETGEFEFSQLATVIGVMPDGYKMHIKVPESVKSTEPGTPGSRAIRYTQGDLMLYNFYKSSNDDYYSMLYNAGRYVTEDTVVEYSDRLNYGEAGADINEDGVVDENDMSILWNPIAPGEPVVFVAGEFEWMSEPADYKKGGQYENKTYTVNGFPFPGGWVDGYYLPIIDGEGYWNYYGRPGGWAGTDKEDETDAEGAPTSSSTPATKGAGIIGNINLASDIDQFWTGAFQRKVFRTRVPAKLDADFKVSVDNLKSVDATLTIEPDENVYRYLFTVLDDGVYHQMLELLDNKTEYVQWAITSYFAMYNFGQIQVVAESGMTSAPPIVFNLTDFYYEVPSDTKYHVLITGMSGEIGSPQCFKHFTFSTPQKTKREGPNVVVKALPEKTTPYSAAFNIRCTSTENNRAERCYYGADYKTGWVYSVNGNSSNSYESLGKTNTFSAEDIAEINSPSGLDVFIPTIDGETIRLVVVAYNDENISNGINQYEDPTSHPAVADCTTPYAKADDYKSWNDLLDTDELVGDWTMTATAAGGKQLSQKVSIKRMFTAGEDYPTALPQDVFDMYKKKTSWTDTQIKGYFDEFRFLSEDPQKGFNTGRLRNQNKLLLEGWFNDSQNTLEYLSPWDLFRNDTISTVDVASCFARFGPKIYIHVNKDKEGKDSLSISANKMFVSPIADWSIPFYMAGRRSDLEEDNTLFQWSDAAGNYVGPLTFPVTLSEDHKTITIRPFEAYETLWYPNVIGVSETLLYGVQYVIENPVISEVVLTKGWTDEPAEPEIPATRASRSMKAAKSVCPKGDVEFGKFYQRNDFTKVRRAEPVQVDGEVITMEKLQENFEKFRKELVKRMR